MLQFVKLTAAAFRGAALASVHVRCNEPPASGTDTRLESTSLQQLTMYIIWGSHTAWQFGSMPQLQRLTLGYFGAVPAGLQHQIQLEVRALTGIWAAGEHPCFLSSIDPWHGADSQNTCVGKQR